MIDLMASARRRIQFENFIFAGDATGRRFANALADAARRGVEVRVLYDPIGTMMVRGGSIARELRKLGITAQPFAPISFHSPRSWLGIRHRDHRKTLTIDGEVGVVGGLCISDNWSPTDRGGHGWRDTALLVRGPVIADVERAFEALFGAGAAVDDAPSGEVVSETAPRAGLVVADRPGLHHVNDLYAWFAEHAHHSLDITDAYMVLPKRTLLAFGDAARRGVSVRLLLPGRNNHPLAGAAARHGYANLLSAGVEIWEWDGVMVHAKTAVVDTAITLVGSSNLDPLSLRRNYELNLLVADPETGAGMRVMFERDLTTATRIDAAGWARRPRWHRSIELLGTMLSSNL
jgi:cardiolipin synthase